MKKSLLVLCVLLGACESSGSYYTEDAVGVSVSYLVEDCSGEFNLGAGEALVSDFIAPNDRVEGFVADLQEVWDDALAADPALDTLIIDWPVGLKADFVEPGADLVVLLMDCAMDPAVGEYMINQDGYDFDVNAVSAYHPEGTDCGYAHLADDLVWAPSLVQVDSVDPVLFASHTAGSIASIVPGIPGPSLRKITKDYRQGIWVNTVGLDQDIYIHGDHVITKDLTFHGLGSGDVTVHQCGTLDCDDGKDEECYRSDGTPNFEVTTYY